MSKNKIPDLVVWSDENGYDANIKPYPTDFGAPAFKLPNVSLARTEESKKMIDVFEKERKEIMERIKKFYDEYNDSILVWESKINFIPVTGHIYFLYRFKNQNVLSLLDPKEWRVYDDFIGAFQLNSDGKWIRKT